MSSIPGSKKRKADATYEEQLRKPNVALPKTQFSHEREIVSTLNGGHNLRSSMPIEPFNSFDRNKQLREDVVDDSCSEDDSSGQNSSEAGKQTQSLSEESVLGEQSDGMTKIDDQGLLLWRASKMDEWRAAVYHKDIRAELIIEAGTRGKYKNPRNSNVQPYDITSYLPSHMNYGSQRRDLPEILFQYEKTEQNESDYVAPVWVHNGRIVLDQVDCPVFDWPEVPATLSSKVEGWLQEFICRTYSRFSIKDFVARMIPGTYGISAINMRRSRFRLKAGCLAWKPRQGSKHIKAFLDELLPNNCRIANSTKEFRDLSSVEVMELKMVGKGKHPERAGSRALTEAQRETVDESFHGNIKITREKQAMTDKTSLGEKRYPKNAESSSVNTDSQEPKGQEPSINKPANLGGNGDNTGPQDGQTRATDLQRQETPVVAARYQYMEINPDPGMNNHVRFYERDYRNVYPTSLYAEMAISRALEPARKQFWYWTGMNAPPTQRKDTYASQWGAIQLLFDDFWLGAGFGSPIPILMMVGVWFGGFAERPVIPAPVNNLSSLRFPFIRQHFIEYYIESIR